jgi:hypothetical protein
LGGYIQSEYNLSQEESAWVYNDAQVFSNAQVSNRVIIGNDLCISSGIWHINPLHIVGTENTVYTCSHNELRIGCMRRTVSEWKDQYREIGFWNGYTDGQIEEYKAIIDFAEQWLDLEFGGTQ